MGRITDKGDRWHRQAWTATGSSWWGGGRAIDWLDWWCAGCIGECCVMLLLGFRSNPIKTLHGVQPHRIPRPTLGQPPVRQIPLRHSLPFPILSNQPQVSFLIAQMWCGIRSMVLQHSYNHVFFQKIFFLDPIYQLKCFWRAKMRECVSSLSQMASLPIPNINNEM